MCNNNSAKEEIISNKDKYPYITKLKFVLEKSNKFDIYLPSFIFGDKLICEFKEIKGKINQTWEVTLFAFETKEEAERMGPKMVLAILWNAVTHRYGVRLAYTTPPPYDVVDRRPGGSTSSGELLIDITRNYDNLEQTIRDVMSSTIEINKINKKMLLSMELFTSARLETTEPSRFIGLIMSLEALAEQIKYDEKIRNRIKTLKKKLDSYRSIDSKTKSSIGNRLLNDLSKESITQSIVNLIEKHLPDENGAVKKIKEAYDIRSKLVHKGTTDADLPKMNDEVREIIRKLYASKLGWELKG